MPADRSLFSDTFKDAYGYRPSAETCAFVKVMSDEEFARYVEDMEFAISESESRRRGDELRAALAFETKIAELIKCGAGDRATALRWLIDGTFDGDAHKEDDGWIEFNFGLAYGYLKNPAPLALR